METWRDISVIIAMLVANGLAIMTYYRWTKRQGLCSEPGIFGEKFHKVVRNTIDSILLSLNSLSLINVRIESQCRTYNFAKID